MVKTTEEQEEPAGRKDRRELIITTNSVEQIKIVWDGTRFAIIQNCDQPYTLSRGTKTLILILNPDEAQKIADFIAVQLLLQDNYL